MQIVLKAFALAGQATASTIAGSTTADVFPPPSTSVNVMLFPGESEVGYAGPTKTGLEPAAIETAPIYPYNEGPAYEFPMVASKPKGDDALSTFNLKKYWGNLSPWYSLSSAEYGLPDASPLVPDSCDIVQVHLLYRHGARYPSGKSAPADFAKKVHDATTRDSGFKACGDLEFLNEWTYKLGSELLTPFGRGQDFMLGLEYRQLYGHLVNNFTEQGTLPVFRTESQDRMVKTAHNFAAGFFGVPEYLDQVNIELMIESTGFNNSGAPYMVCNNSQVDSRGMIGDTVAAMFAETAFNDTLARLNSQLEGSLHLTATDAIAMLQLCSYETNALGYSAFCKLFTQDDYLNYEYYCDLEFYYSSGPGSPVSAAQGKAFLQEYVARFTHTYPEALSSLNLTLDDNPTYFPLNQSIYADATHEVVILNTLTALNLTAVFKGPPLNLTRNEHQNSFVASKIVPFATHFTVQVLECPAYQPSKQVRFIVNDAVIPVADSYEGCKPDPNGMCPFETVVGVLQKRIDEIDFDYDCYADYAAMPGVDYNGRAPRS